MNTAPAPASATPPETPVGEDWAGEMGEKWLANLDRFEGMIAPIGEALLAQADYQLGERVIDLGCGGGATTLAIARAVGPDGEVAALDISPALIGEARARAAAAGLDNIRFHCADAATAMPQGAPFDRLFSRFGSMFFAEPHSAFANLHAMLKAGARIDLAVWGPPRDNLWMMGVMGVVREHIEIPPAIPRTPGPFALEDVAYLTEVLDAGGFSGIEIAPYTAKQPLGGQGAAPAEAADFILSAMAVGRALEEHGDEVREAARADLVRLFERHYQDGQGVMMGCKAWLVSAQA
ncbi:MAG: class I SAM-dependent methyltransferase [Erythrobacter sp.]